MTVNSGEQCQNANSVAILHDRGTIHTQSELQFSLSSLVEVSNSFKTQMCLDTQVHCKDHINLKMENADSHATYIVDIDVEKGKSDPLISNGESGGNMKSEDMLTALQREINLQLGGKFIQLLMTYIFVLPKFICRDKSMTDRVHDTTNNRIRKYKRSASFDSRRVVLLFSVMSSMGTMILIYLTLRVRQIDDGSLHV